MKHYFKGGRTRDLPQSADHQAPQDDASRIGNVVMLDQILDSHLSAVEHPSAAVTKIVNSCKDRMLELCLEVARIRGLAPFRLLAKAYESRPGGDDMGVLEAYLRLEPDIVNEFSEQHRNQLDEILRNTEEELEGVLDEADMNQVRQDGIRPLLANRDYPIVASFLTRLNGIEGEENTGDYSGLFCPKPFQEAEVAQGGRTFLCCPLQLPTVVGDVNDGTFMEVWNSERAQAIRRSILDGSFSYCLERTCGDLQGRKLPRREDVDDPYLRAIIENNVTRLERGPITLTMNYDRSCNLKCPTCRMDLITLKGKAKQEAINVQEWATSAQHLKDVLFLHFTGSGDAFGSQIFHSFLRNFDAKKFPGVNLSLGTNGLLFTEKTWKNISNEAVRVAVISVDAATPETYAINRGGDFGLLRENLRFIGGLRSAGKLLHFGINMVVQANNYAEMSAFVELGKSCNADFVFFQQLMNWGTFSEEEFWSRAVHRPEHPRHEDLLRVLRDPALSQPMVNLHNLSSLQENQHAQL